MPMLRLLTVLTLFSCIGLPRGSAQSDEPAKTQPDLRNSGIMTFIVGKDGTVYQKDLGEKTEDVAVAMAEYNPGDGWNSVTGTDARSQ